MREILFYLVIFLANIIQGITGFAGTILAMPFCLILVGYSTAKPILNLLGFLSGIYVFCGNAKYVHWKEVARIVFVMSFGILLAEKIKTVTAGKDDVLYIILGLYVLYLAISGLFRKRKYERELKRPERLLVLIVAGTAHGLFVSGGPILVGYLSRITKDKREFRATISTVWIFLNGLILVMDITSGLFTTQLINESLIAAAVLFCGMFVGSILYKKMNQQTFMKITYILLFIAGVTILWK